MCASGGVLSLGDDVSAPQLTDAELTAIIDEAHRLKRKTAAHSHGDLAARSAVKAGIDSIEHGSFLTDETLALMKSKGTFLVPTCMAGQWTGNKLERFPPAVAAKAKAALDAHDDMMRRAIRSGVKIAFGTDSGVGPHGSNAGEFALLVERGMTPAAGAQDGGPGGRGAARPRRRDRHAREGQAGRHRRGARRSARGHPGHRARGLRHEGRRDREVPGEVNGENPGPSPFRPCALESPSARDDG